MSTTQSAFDPDRLFMPAGPAFIESGIRGRPLSEASHKLTIALRRKLHGRIAIMGIGNPMLADDGVGCVIVHRLEEALAHRPSSAPGAGESAGAITLVHAEEVPESHTGVVESAHPTVIVFIDAADLGAAPGSLALIEGRRLDFQAAFTHRTPLGPLARYLEERTHASVFLIGIQPGRMEWGDPLTPDVASTADQLVAVLLHALHPQPVPEPVQPAEAPAPGEPAVAASPEAGSTPEAPVC
ncbi:MAG TPA: hydrogenase maturation protease [Longimicrobiales bacterium]